MSATIENRLALLRAASDGQREGLLCPACGRPSIAVSQVEAFDWFTCWHCDFVMRAQRTGN